MAKQRDLSLRNRAYRFIRAKIEDCEYEPNQMLSESMLREEIGVSRTPVREAIGRLAREGLVKVYPKRGIMVSGLSIRNIRKIYEVRLLVEPYVLATCHERLDLAEIARFSAVFRAYEGGGRPLDVFSLDDQFHAELMSASDNDYLSDLYDTVRVQSARLRIIGGRLAAPRVLRAMRDHAKIADACVARDWSAAASAMEKHLKFAEKSLLGSMLKNPEQEI